MSKFFIVFQKEYYERVKKRSFIILTLLSPLLFMGIILVPIFLATGVRDTSEKKVLVVDHTDKYFTALSQAPKHSDNFVFVKSDATVQELRGNKQDDVYAYVVISDDLLENPRGLTIFSYSSIPPTLELHISDVLKPELQKEKIESFNIPNLEQIIDDTKVTLNISTVQWSETGEEVASSAILSMIVGQVFNILIFMFVVTYGSMVMTSVSQEKKSRIVEIISSSVKPTTLLFAKITAIGCVGLTQVGIWIVAIVLLFIGAQSFLFNSVTMDLNELQAVATSSGQFDPQMVQEILQPLANFDFGGMTIAFIFYFICGYISFASIYAAFGAAMDSDEDVSQISMPIVLLMLFGFYISIYSVENPNGPLAVAFSFVPLVAPGVMMVRLPFNPPTIEVVISVLVMILSTALFVWLSAKIFRVGLLMYGKKPSFKEMLKWLRFN